MYTTTIERWDPLRSFLLAQDGQRHSYVVVKPPLGDLGVRLLPHYQHGYFNVVAHRIYGSTKQNVFKRFMAVSAHNY